MAGRNIYLNACPYNAFTSHFSMTRGEDVTLNVNMTPPVDITGWTLTFTIMTTLAGSNVYTATPTIIDGPRGNMTVAINHANTNTATVGRYVWDIRREDSGAWTSIADGTLDLRQEVSS